MVFQVYWTDWRTHSIHSCDKATGGNTTVVLDQIYAPMDIHAFEPSRQPQGEIYVWFIAISLHIDLLLIHVSNFIGIATI